MQAYIDWMASMAKALLSRWVSPMTVCGGAGAEVCPAVPLPLYYVDLRISRKGSGNVRVHTPAIMRAEGRAEVYPAKERCWMIIKAQQASSTEGLRIEEPFWIHDCQEY